MVSVEGNKYRILEKNLMQILLNTEDRDWFTESAKKPGRVSQFFRSRLDDPRLEQGVALRIAVINDLQVGKTNTTETAANRVA